VVTKPKTLLTRRLVEEPMARLRAQTDAAINLADRAMTRAELLAAVADAEGLLSMVTDRVDAELMDAAPRLKVVANHAVGYDNIDVAAATERGIWVANTPGVLTDATADLAFALLLAVSRRVVEGDAFVRSGTWGGWEPLQMLGASVSGATLGLVGLGRIGRAVARRAQAFDMRVLYWNRTRLEPDDEAALGVTYAPFEELLARARFVSLHVASNPETRHLINAAALELIGPGGYLINTARGNIVDEAALVTALQEGRIAGAGLDVFEEEPALAPGLAECANAVLTPHLGSSTVETRTAMGNLAVDNLLAVLEGKPPLHAVNSVPTI